MSYDVGIPDMAYHGIHQQKQTALPKKGCLDL